MQKRRLLVTGGSGYLGDWIVRQSHAQWDVTATFFSQPGTYPDVSWRRLDVRDVQATTTLIAEVAPDVVIHSAAAYPGSTQSYEQVNVGGTRNVARSAAAVGARLIHVSTDVIFDGERPPYIENDPPSPITAYGESKARAEAALETSGADAVIVRTSLIYGWRPTLDRQTRWVLEGLRQGTPPQLFTDEIRCPIWVETLSAALLELAERKFIGILHVAGAQPLSRYAFGRRLARFHGADPAPLVPTLSRESGLRRPLDCTLVCDRARALLHTPLPGVDAVLDTTPRC